MGTSLSRSVLASTGDTKPIPELSQRLRHTSVSVIKEMMYLGAQETKKGKDIISLGVGIPYYPAPQFVHAHIQEQLQTNEDIDRYTLLIGLPKLREKIAQEAQQTLHMPVTAEEILVTPGSMAALFYSMLALVNPGDEVILPSPYFSSHAEQVAIAGGTVVEVPFLFDKEHGFVLDVNGIEKAISPATKAIILNSPHNPTGAVFREEDLRAVAALAQKHAFYIITDEVYEYLVYDDAPYFNIATLQEVWPRIIRCCSFSKKYGMMGWRVGFLHTNKDLLMHILKVHDANIVCAPHISQEAAFCALSGPQDIVGTYKDMLSKNRTIMSDCLKRLPDLFSFVEPKGAYYMFPSYTTPSPSIEMAKTLLFEAGVVTVPGIGFGSVGENHLRLSFGGKPADIHRAFDRIETWWKKKGKP